MARIPEEEIERLKREISLERLVAARGIELKRHGADLLGLCPFHDDREPSLVISPKKNLWHCLGACQTGGTVIDWVMKADGVSFRHAVELLRADHPSLTALSRSVKHSTVRKLPPPIDRDADDGALLAAGGRLLSRDAEAVARGAGSIWKSAGLESAEMIERFQLGFANRTLGYGCRRRTARPARRCAGRLQTLGIMRESGHEHFNGSVVIPVFDRERQRGRRCTAARSRDESAARARRCICTCRGRIAACGTKRRWQASKEIILCEALIDALTFWCAGYRNVTASYGVSGFTDDHRAAFQKYGTQNVSASPTTATKPARKHLALLRAVGDGDRLLRVLFPKGMDANEYALKVTPAAKRLGVLLNKAEWLGKGKPPDRRASNRPRQSLTTSDTTSRYGKTGRTSS